MSEPLRFYLRPDFASFYVADAAGAVTTTSARTSLQCEPMEGAETEVKYLRNTKTHGLFRENSNALSFVKDGAAILAHIDEEQGPEGVCILEIERFNTNTWSYEPFYIGDIDFSTGTGSRLNYRVEVADRGLPALIKAFETTPYEIPLLNSDSTLALLDGITLKARYKYAPFAAPFNSGQPGAGQDVGSVNSKLVRMVNYGQDGDYPVAIPRLQIDDNNANFGGTAVATVTFDSFFYQALLSQSFQLSLNLRVDWKNDGQSSNPAKFNLWLYIAGQDRTIKSSTLLYQGANFVAPGSAETYNINYAGPQIAMAPGDRAFLAVNLTQPAAGNTTATFTIHANPQTSQPYYFFADATFRQASTPVRGYRYIDLLQKLLDRISPGSVVKSSYLSNKTLQDYDARPYNALITCGDALRNLGNGDFAEKAPKLKLTLEECRQDLLGRFGLGMGVEGNTLVIEKLSYFYRKGTVSVPNLGEVKGLTTSWDAQYLGNKFRFGYKENDYDGLNGRDEFNTTLVFGAPVIRSTNELDYTAAFRCDMYGIEKLRANLSNKDTTDSGSDNDIFVIEISDTIDTLGRHLLARPQNAAGSTLSGLIAGNTAFNLGYSPRRCFYRLAPLVAVSTWRLQGKKLTFQTSDKNPAMVAKLSPSSPTVAETADAAVNGLPEPLFTPKVFEFETAVPVDLPALISGNPYGEVAFEYKGRLLSGFVDDVGIRPANNATYTYKLRQIP